MAYLLSRGRSCSRTVAIGVDPLKSLTTGINNIAIGEATADALTTGICNIALGMDALGASTTGVTGYIEIGNSTIVFNTANDSTASSGNFYVSNLSSDGHMMMSGTYLTD